MEDYYEYLDSNGVTTLYKLIKDDTVALIDSYSVTINGITTTLDTHINDSDIHTPISDIENMIDTKIAGLVNSAPETLDTLKELSDALGNDPNFATTVANQIGTKANKDDVYTKEETDTLLEGKANSVHNHVVSDITDFPTIPTKTSELINDSGFLTGSNGLITSVSWSDITNKPNFSTVATSGSYTDLSNTPTIPTKVSQLENDMGFGTGGDTSDCVHKTGNETIDGIKTFTDKTISNKELHYKDTLYDWSNTSLNTWCDAGHVAWFDKTGNRRMHELVGAQNGVWRKACYINENQYFSVDSNRNISYWGTANFNGLTIFTQDIIYLNNNIDLTVTPSSTLYSNFIFKDKNHQNVAFLQYAKRNMDPDVLGLYIHDKDKNLHGIQITSNNYLLPSGDNIYNLGSPNNRWANAYITNTYTNRVTTYSITHHTDDSYFFMSGGTDYNKGATLYLGGVYATNFTPGRFALAARKTDGSSVELAGSPNGSLTWGGKSLAIDENLVHRSGDEYINGNKVFTNIIHRYADLTTSGGVQVYRFVDANANSCGHIYNNALWAGNAIYNVHGAYNAKTGKLMEIAIFSTDSGDGLAFVAGTATIGNLETVTSATGHNGIATMGWVNNPATSTNVVHRSGDETIAGNKTFLSGYATTPATSDNSTRIATTAWVRTYVNSVVGSGSVGASISAYYSNATTLTEEGDPSSSGGSYTSDHSNYIHISPKVGTIYTGSQLFGTLNASASGSKYSYGTSSGLIYQTTAKATATFSGAFSPSSKYLCTTANAVRFRAYVSQGTNSDIGTASVVDNSSAKSIFIRVQ